MIDWFLEAAADSLGERFPYHLKHRSFHRGGYYHELFMHSGYQDGKEYSLHIIITDKCVATLLMCEVIYGSWDLADPGSPDVIEVVSRHIEEWWTK